MDNSSGEMAIVLGTFTYSQCKFQNAQGEAISLVTMNARLCTSSGSRRVNLTIAEPLFCFLFCLVKSQLYASKGLFTWSGGPRSSGVGFFCFHALEDTKQKKPTPLDWGPPLHVNRV